MIDFNHRLNGHDTKAHEIYTLLDAINGMSNRAKASINLLQSSFTGELGFHINDETAFHALESVYMELIDIKNVVSTKVKLI